MSDRFDEVMRKYLVPMSAFVGPPVDSLYFLHKKGGLVYCEGYAHPPDGFYGALIKYQDPKGHIDIFGRKFNWTHRRYEKGELVIIPGDQQVRRMKQVYPELADRPPSPPFADHFCQFYFSEMQGFFDTKRSMELLCAENPRLKEVVESLHGLLGVPRERIGCSGSLAYGFYEEPLEDVDATFFGTVEQNYEVVQRILDLLKREPQRQVSELGKTWPIRFKHMGTVICPFFRYAVPEEIPYREFTMELVASDVAMTGTVADARHTPYLPAVLPLEKVTHDHKPHAPIELVIYDGALRGELFTGDRVHLKCKLVKVTKAGRSYEAALVTKPGELKKA